MPFQKLVIWKSCGERAYVLVFMSNKMNKELLKTKMKKGGEGEKKKKQGAEGKKIPRCFLNKS